MKSSLKINYYNLVCYTVIKNLPANEGDAGLGLGQEDPLEEEIATTPVFLPGKYLGQRNLVSYSPWGPQRVRHDLLTKPPPPFILI